MTVCKAKRGGGSWAEALVVANGEQGRRSDQVRGRPGWSPAGGAEAVAPGEDLSAIGTLVRGKHQPKLILGGRPREEFRALDRSSITSIEAT